MMKKIMLAAVCLMMAVGVRAELKTWTDPMTGLSWKYVVFQSDENLQWTFSAYSHLWGYLNDGVAVCGVTPAPAGVLTIPSVVDGYKVRAVATYLDLTSSIESFMDYCQTVTRVEFPSTLKAIGSDVCRWCPNLKEIVLPEGLLYIGKYSFMECGITKVEYPSTLLCDSSSLWSNPTIVQASVRGGANDVWRFEDGAMYYTSAYSQFPVYMPEEKPMVKHDSLEGISKNIETLVVREGCLCLSCTGHSSKLKTVVVAESVDGASSYAFNDCKNLTAVYFKGRVLTFAVGGNETFFEGSPNVITYVLRNKGWDDIVASGTWQGRPIKYYDGKVPEGDKPSGKNVPDEWKSAHVFNGLVYDASDVMVGMAQVTTAKPTKKGEVKVSGFVILEDGKKQSVKSKAAVIENGNLKVSTTVGKIGDLELAIDGNGFVGTLGSMKLTSASVDESTGIISATVKVQYFDAKTAKLKSKSVKMTGVTSGGEAVGNITQKGLSSQPFKAEIEYWTLPVF